MGWTFDSYRSSSATLALQRQRFTQKWSTQVCVQPLAGRTRCAECSNNWDYGCLQFGRGAPRPEHSNLPREADDGLGVENVVKLIEMFTAANAAWRREYTQMLADANEPITAQRIGMDLQVPAPGRADQPVLATRVSLNRVHASLRYRHGFPALSCTTWSSDS